VTLIEALARFDRKERNWLVRDALGDGARTLGRDFRDRIETQVKKRDRGFTLGADAWWAIDYHTDRIVAALHTVQHGVPDQPLSNEPRVIEGHQQDIDLVVASDRTLILVESKGVGSWKGAGLKARRSG
jgi:hypothetical protein